ncbi:MAG: hypothetical protein CL608_12560 [Anaerolineaceae bacterium]|nr:hypothetical protein [Anaerolineaceae bacterium]
MSKIMDLETVLDNHVQAIGGYAVVEKLHSIKIGFHLVEPTFAVDGMYCATRQNQMRVDILADGVRVFSESVNGSQGWQLRQNDETSKPTSPAGTRALQRGIENHLFGLHELPAGGHTLTLQEQETIDETDYFVIRLNYADGDAAWRYINAASWLVERSRVQAALHPDVDPTETTLETHYADFREVDGLLRPFQDTQIDLTTGETVQTTTVKTIRLNPSFPDDYFAAP